MLTRVLGWESVEKMSHSVIYVPKLTIHRIASNRGRGHLIFWLVYVARLSISLCWPRVLTLIGLADNPGRCVRDTDIQDLPLLNEHVECLHDLLDAGSEVPPV